MNMLFTTHQPCLQLEGKLTVICILCNIWRRCHQAGCTYPGVDAGTRSILASGSATSSSTWQTSPSGPPPPREAWASTLCGQDNKSEHVQFATWGVDEDTLQGEKKATPFLINLKRQAHAPLVCKSLFCSCTHWKVTVCSANRKKSKGVAWGTFHPSPFSAFYIFFLDTQSARGMTCYCRLTWMLALPWFP